ncbi:MAG: iron-sulfur cluster biosynthesis family protein [Balneolales bacterium]
MTVTFTSQARKKISRLLKAGEMHSPEVRLSSGCAGCGGGLSVGLAINESPQKSDKTLEVDDLMIYVEKDSEQYVGDTVVDYTDNDFGGNFIVSNEYGSSVCFIGMI